jgi:hypothetical protein
MQMQLEHHRGILATYESDGLILPLFHGASGVSATSLGRLVSETPEIG